MSGARQVLDQQQRLGRRAIIGEPTGLRPIRMHKGVLMESITVRGQSGHSSNPALGANAIIGMQQVLYDLLAFQEELKARYRNPAFTVDYPTLNLGAIHGGDSPNRICGHCETLIDIRPLPGMDLSALQDALEGRLRDTLRGFPDLSLEVRPLFEGVPPFETPADAPVTKACEEISGLSAGAVAFGTEAPFLSQMGIETIIMGPGHIDQAHQPDEYMALAQIQPAIESFSSLIERFCLTA